MSPSRFTFILVQTLASKALKVLTRDYGMTLAWVARFEPVISVQMIVRDMAAVEDLNGDYGWRPLRHWRRVLMRVGVVLPIPTMATRASAQPIWDINLWT